MKATNPIKDTNLKKVVAYCRVSTNKEEQLDSLESQQKFFAEYSSRNNFELVRIYADVGKSGTKMKNRIQLLKMLSDARRGCFELVLIKDVSRLARNTLDFLTSVRSLKALGIKVLFINYDQTSSDSSEFMLTMLSAIAQEESANTSKRVKFGKALNAEHGRVPNLVYGYDKINGDYFNLDINNKEAAIVTRIFTMYTEKNMGTNRIAKVLNQENIKTKRGYAWSQIAVSRILANEIYIGKIVNGKQEVEDFLTGKRRNLKQDKWMVIKRPELRVVEESTFHMAQDIIARRQNAFHQTGKRMSNKHVLSQLLNCKHCGSSFRRLVRTYKKTHITWVCNGRNSNGTGFCVNATQIDEKEMLDAIQEYFISILSSRNSIVQNIMKDYNRKYKAKDENQNPQKDYIARLNKLDKDKQKYMEMYANDILTMEDLKQKTVSINKEVEYYRSEVDLINKKSSEGAEIEIEIMEEVTDITHVLNLDIITNAMLKCLINRIDIDENGNVDVYLADQSESN